MLHIDGNGRRLTLAGRFTIYHVAELLAYLRGLELAPMLEIDLSGVTDFDMVAQ